MSGYSPGKAVVAPGRDLNPGFPGAHLVPVDPSGISELKLGVKTSRARLRYEREELGANLADHALSPGELRRLGRRQGTLSGRRGTLSGRRGTLSGRRGTLSGRQGT